MSVRVEFFFDLSSPWTRLAFHNIQQLPEATQANIVWRPFLVGGVFNAVNQRVYEARVDPENSRLKLSFHWLKQWAKIADLPMNFPSRHHPLKSVLAMRVCCALEDDQTALHRFAQGAFDAYFNHQRNLDDPAELAAVASELGFEGESLIAETQEQAIKDRLRANTEQAIERGAFGSPTIFVGGDNLYFGNDQLPLVAQKIRELS